VTEESCQIQSRSWRSPVESKESKESKESSDSMRSVIGSGSRSFWLYLTSFARLLLPGRPLGWYSIRLAVKAILSSDVGDVGTLFVGNCHAADGDTFLFKCFRACIGEELLESTARRVLQMVLQV
jgi:hypothetical protein